MEQRAIIFTMLLAQSFCNQPGLAARILGDYQNPQQIFAEPSLLSRLEAGQLDAASGYLSATSSRTGHRTWRHPCQGRNLA